MANFVKIGKKYIKYDNNHKEEYSFDISRNEYGQIVISNFTVQDHSIMVGEKMVKEKNAIFNVELPDLSGLIKSNKDVIKKIQGEIVFASNCFKGVNNINLSVPYDSVKLSHDCFDNDANINIILNANCTIKDIYYLCTYENCIESEAWPLICDKSLLKEPLDFNTSEYAAKAFKNESIMVLHKYSDYEK